MASPRPVRTPTEDAVESVGGSRWRRRHPVVVPLGVLSLALLITAGFTHYLSDAQEARDRDHFRNAVHATQDRIRARVTAYTNVLEATAGFFSVVDGGLTPSEFRDYVRRLDLRARFPGLHGIGFARRVLAGESDAQVREVWDLPSSVTLDPPRAPGASRDVVVMMEPLDESNRAALGRDPASRPEARAAMERAADDGSPAVSAVIAHEVEADPQKQKRFLLFVPVYRTGLALTGAAERRVAVDGYVFGAFHGEDFFRGIFGTEVSPRVGFEVFDGTVVDPARVLHRWWPAGFAGSDLPFQETARLRIAGRYWMLRVHGRPAPRLPVVPFVLVAGLATSALLFLSMFYQVRGRHAAESAAAELRRSTRLVRRSERRLRTLIEGLPEAISVYVEGKMVFCNPAMEAILGPRASGAGGDALSTVVVDDRSKLARALASFAGEDESGPRATGEALPLEMRFLGAAVVHGADTEHGGGAIEPVQTEGFLLPIEFDGLPAVLGVWRDVTQKRQLAARMMQMDRMIAVGTLAAGVAHEINNPLAFVIANVEFARRELARVPSGSGAGAVVSFGAGAGAEMAEVIRALVEARDGAERMRRIVRDLRTFSRGDDGSERRQGPPAVDVRRAVDWACAMAQNEIRHRAKLVVAVDDSAHVACDEARLGQVLLNLVMNAAHAIPEGAAERNQIRVAARDDGEGHVAIEVRDTGSGIAPENLARIFDPFFTTKPVGVGTGLGLAIVQRIVTDHGGHVIVDSEAGRGTTVRVTLPVARSPAVVAPASLPAPAPAPAPQRPRVLVIDDEVQVLRAIQRNLASTHEVIALTRAEEALERLQSGERFDAVVCDLMMPEMTGMDLHAALATAGSAAARSMVFITGGAFTPRAREFLASVDNPRLEKPFDFDVLRRTIRSA